MSINTQQPCKTFTLAS